MNIIEVKNNLVKLSYEEDVKLASFIKISDIAKSYIAQIIHIEATRIGKIAIARLIFNFTATVQAYDGSIPSIQSDVEVLDDNFYINQLDKKDSMIIGQLPTSNNDIVISSNILKDRPLICAEKAYQANILIENILKQNELNNKKTIVIDLSGQLRGNKITATKDFRLPLDKKSIDYIFENGFNDLTPENKAYIQDIFSEIREYVKTVDYIPFRDFNAVIESEFNRTQQLQLIILKNRLNQFNKSGLFAQTKEEFTVLDNKLANDYSLVIDLSLLNAQFQQEYITYIYEQMSKKNSNFYAIVQIDNNNSSDSLLHTILGAKNVFTSVVCPYNYRYLTQLKQCSKNMIMFTPIKQINDFGAYNVFLNRLAEDEFILYGKTTKFIPIIVKMSEIENFESITTEKDQTIENIQTVEEPIQDDIVKDEEILNTIVENNQINETEEVESLPEEITEKVFEEEEKEKEINTQNYHIEEPEPLEDAATYEVVESDNTSLIVEEQPIQEYPEIIEESEIIEDIAEQETEPVEEISVVQDEIQEPDETIEQEFESEFDEISIDISDEEIAEAIELEAPETEMSFAETIEDIKDDIEDYDDEQEEELEQDDDDDLLNDLSDDDLDLIEELDNIEDVQDDIIETISPETEEDEEIEQNEDYLEIQETLADDDLIDAVSENTITEEPLPNATKKASITDEILQEEAIKQAELDNLPKEDPIEKHIEPATVKNKSGLETKQVDTPEVPVYSAEIPDEDIVESDPVQQGDVVEHQEFGRGIVEKIINYGDRTLCSVNFDQIGRRLLDPKVSELKKI